MLCVVHIDENGIFVTVIILNLLLLHERPTFKRFSVEIEILKTIIY